MSRPTATWAGVTRTIRVPDATSPTGVECLVVLNRDETGTLRGLRDDAAPVRWGPGPGAAVLSLPDALARLLDPDAEKGDEP